MVVLPAASVAATVTLFVPGCNATVALQAPSELTVVFTPLTVTVEPGSALPLMTVLEPVTVAPASELTDKAGAVVSFCTEIFNANEAFQAEFMARREMTLVPSPIGRLSKVKSPWSLVLTATKALPASSNATTPTCGDALPFNEILDSFVEDGGSTRVGWGR